MGPTFWFNTSIVVMGLAGAASLVIALYHRRGKDGRDGNEPRSTPSSSPSVTTRRKGAPERSVGSKLVGQP